jgi:hypothetical protein
VSRIGLVTALLPPAVGGTEILVWRLFRDQPGLVIVSGAATAAAPPSGADDFYTALQAPTLELPYPRLRGYRYGLATMLGTYAAGWLAFTLERVVRFFRSQGVEQIISIPHQGPFALLGLLAARRLGLPHTFYILDAWEEGATGPLERGLIRLGLHLAARMPRSRLAVVSPTLGAHYRAAFRFRDVVWIPNPAPLAVELPSIPVTARPFVLFTGGIKPFNAESIRRVVGAIRRCKVAEKLIITGQSGDFAADLRARGELHDRVEFRSGSRQEIALLQRQAAVLLIATNVDDLSQTARGYLPGRLPEYVSTRRPILVIGPEDSDAARAVEHWRLGQITSSRDEAELAQFFDSLATQGMESAIPRGGPDPHDLFLELFSRDEARRRLFGTPAPALSVLAAELGASFEAR